ncbi:alpha/beta hydrolase [Massilia sp. 9096]|uniref:alpha/beta hydrolase n=1 Tax=Massilia sp. 9096 TaxID=1500894 RepID=UPI0005675EF2|nr:alpha/beta hydrolase [Massilia sp. 9096]
MDIDEATLQASREFNRKLAHAPRFKVRNRFTPMLIQALMRLSQFNADRKVARAGIQVESMTATMDALRVPVRVLRPAGAPRGVVLDYHGGGWVIGNARMNDALNMALVQACGVAVVSVDYRLATRAPIQHVMDDCLAAARWLLQGGLGDSFGGFDGLPVFLVGESAGGHLAAATLLRLKAWPELLARIAGAVLYYGVYDLAGTPSVHSAGPDTLVLHGPGMVSSLRMLTPGLTDAERRQAPLSPLFGDLSGLPPALLFAGQLDPLRDDSIEMAARWRTANAHDGAHADAHVNVQLHLLPEVPHGVIHFPIPMAQRITARTHAWIGARIAALASTSLSP